MIVCNRHPARGNSGSLSIAQEAAAWLTANIFAVRDAAVPVSREQWAAMPTHSSKQDSASSERDSEGAAALFFDPLSPPPAPLPLLPLLPLDAILASLAAADVFPSASCGGGGGGGGGGDAHAQHAQHAPNQTRKTLFYCHFLVAHAREHSTVGTSDPTATSIESTQPPNDASLSQR